MVVVSSCMGGTRGFGVLSNAADVLGMSVVRGMKRNAPHDKPTYGETVTAVWQTMCKLCRPFTPPAIGV